jgi:hypothetical protein
MSSGRGLLMKEGSPEPSSGRRFDGGFGALVQLRGAVVTSGKRSLHGTRYRQSGPMIRGSSGNLRNPAQPGATTTRSEAQGVHIVHTLFLPLAGTLTNRRYPQGLPHGPNRV